MFILKEMENSDVRCNCTTTTFAGIKSAQKLMKEWFEKTKELLGETFEDGENDALSPEEQRWAKINQMSAHIQDGIDAFDWEILEDPQWIRKDDSQENLRTSVTDESIREFTLGDKVTLLDKFDGTVVFECGAYGIGFEKAVDWDYIESQVTPITCCDNAPKFCYNDNFISFWELLWNFDCEGNICSVVKIKDIV